VTEISRALCTKRRGESRIVGCRAAVFEHQAGGDPLRVFTEALRRKLPLTDCRYHSIPKKWAPDNDSHVLDCAGKPINGKVEFHSALDSCLHRKCGVHRRHVTIEPILFLLNKLWGMALVLQRSGVFPQFVTEGSLLAGTSEQDTVWPKALVEAAGSKLRNYSFALAL
jgi:hypothetical protein